MKKSILILIILLFSISLSAAEGSTVSFKPDMRLIFHYGYDMDAKTHLFDLERSYIGIKAIIDNVTFRATLDVKDVDIDDDGTEAVDLKRIYLKYAYAEIKKLIPLSKLIFGQQKTGLIDFEGKLWGHRAVAKVPLDAYSMDTSADMGFGIDIKLPNKLGGLHLSYFSGEGYKGSTSEDLQQKAASLRVNINLGPLMVTGYFKTWWMPADTDNENLFGTIISLKNDMLSAAVEIFMLDTGTTERVIALYGTYHAIPGKLDIFARFDMNDPDTDLSDDSVNNLIAGLKYRLASKTSLYLALQVSMFEDSSKETAKGINLAFDQKF